MILLDMVFEEKVKKHTMELACSMKRTIFLALGFLQIGGVIYYK